MKTDSAESGRYEGGTLREGEGSALACCADFTRCGKCRRLDRGCESTLVRTHARGGDGLLMGIACSTPTAAPFLHLPYQCTYMHCSALRPNIKIQHQNPTSNVQHLLDHPNCTCTAHLTLKHRAVDPAVSSPSLEAVGWSPWPSYIKRQLSGASPGHARNLERRLDLSRVECLRSRSSVLLGCWNVLLGSRCCAPDAVSVPVSGDPFHRHRPSAIAMAERELRWRCHALARARARAELPLVRCLLWVEITLRCSGWDPGFRTGTAMQPMQPTHPTQPTQPRNLLAKATPGSPGRPAQQPSSPVPPLQPVGQCSAR